MDLYLSLYSTGLQGSGGREKRMSPQAAASSDSSCLCQRLCQKGLGIYRNILEMMALSPHILKKLCAAKWVPVTGDHQHHTTVRKCCHTLPQSSQSVSALLGKPPTSNTRPLLFAWKGQM